ncbi:MAG: hypothetical protein ACQGVK_25350 [Myxococcota bacterium]
MTRAPVETPDARAQRERAAGAWALWIEQRPGSEAEWSALRRALRFSRADEAWLRARVPGAVRRGARLDLEAAVEALRALGFRASLRRAGTAAAGPAGPAEPTEPTEPTGGSQ